MTVGELITELEKFPKDMRVVMFPEGGWSNIDSIARIFSDWVGIFDEEKFKDDVVATTTRKEDKDDV